MPEQFVAEQTVEQNLPDPVRSECALPLRATLYPLGFPLIIDTNSQEVIRAVCDAWGQFSREFETAPMRLSLGVAKSDVLRLPPDSTFRSREHLMSVFADAENFVVCDFSQHYAFGWVNELVAADHPFLRYRFVSPAVHMLMEEMALAPLHCALIARNGRGVGLFGESFAGKSTLAYGCARAGWTFVTDDATFLVRDRSDRYALGDPYAFRLRESAKPLFPELADRFAVVRPNGKMAMEVLTGELPIATASGCSMDHIVFLNRNEPGPARLRRYSKDAALADWERHITFGTREVRDAQSRCFERLSGGPIWELCYRDLDDAIARLERLVESGE